MDRQEFKTKYDDLRSKLAALNSHLHNTCCDGVRYDIFFAKSKEVVKEEPKEITYVAVYAACTSSGGFESRNDLPLDPILLKSISAVNILLRSFAIGNVNYAVQKLEVKSTNPDDSLVPFFRVEVYFNVFDLIDPGA